MDKVIKNKIKILDDEKNISVDDYAIDNSIVRDKETYDSIIKLVEKGGKISEDQDVIYNCQWCMRLSLKLVGKIVL